MVWGRIWREGIFIRKVSKWCFWFKLSTGVKVFIWVVSISSFINLIFQLLGVLNSKEGKIKWSPIQRQFDTYWLLFDGKLNFFSTIYTTLGTLMNLTTNSLFNIELHCIKILCNAITGIYSWISSFRLHVFEYNKN